MQDPNQPGLPKIHIDQAIFESINNSLIDLKRNYSPERLIDQMILMNQIMQSLVDQVSKSWDMHAEHFSGSLAAHRDHLKAHNDHLDAHDGHLKTHDEHLLTVSKRIDILKERVDEIKE